MGKTIKNAINDQPKTASRKWRILLGLFLMVLAVYFLIIYFSPKLPSLPVITKTAIDLNIQNDVNDFTNRLQIPALKIEVPYSSGNYDVLSKGAWHRKPENGDPLMGGNFVLAAHRFEFGITPSQTKQKSPFYNIDKLKIGDEIKIMFQGKWYIYSVAKKYEVPPTALEIENISTEPKMTLYSCSLNGAAAGRYVIEAKPNF